MPEKTTKRKGGFETLEGWCDRLGVTFRKSSLQRREVSGYPRGSKHYMIELDRDGADAKLLVQWTEEPGDPPTVRPAQVVKDMLENALNVERVARDRDGVKAQYNMADPEAEWPALFQSLVEERDRFIAWMSRIEYDKLKLTVDGEESQEGVA